MKRSIFFVAWAITIVFLGFGRLSAQDPKVFVENLIKDSLEIVNKKISDDEKRTKLSENINKYLDLNWLSEKVFGDSYKSLTNDNDKKRVKEYLKSYLLKFYAGEGKLSAISGASLLPITEKDIEKEKNHTKVTTRFSKDNTSNKVTIAWVTENNKILYIEVEGINQLITLRSEMNAAVNGGSLLDFIKQSGF